MKTLGKIFSILIVISLASCSSMKITSDRNDKYDFSNIESYRIEYAYDEKNSNYVINELLQDRIYASLNEELIARGLLTSEDPDIIITYSTDVDARKNYSTNSTYMGGGPYYYGRYYGGYGMGSTFSTTNEYLTYEGKLVISMYEQSTGKLLWYSGGQKELNLNGKNSEANLAKAISKIMEEFPLEKIDNSLTSNK